MNLRYLIAIFMVAIVIILYVFVEPWIAMLVFGFSVLIGGLINAFYIAVKVPGGFDEKSRPEATEDSGLS